MLWVLELISHDHSHDEIKSPKEIKGVQKNGNNCLFVEENFSTNNKVILGFYGKKFNKVQVESNNNTKYNSQLSIAYLKSTE